MIIVMTPFLLVIIAVFVLAVVISIVYMVRSFQYGLKYRNQCIFILETDEIGFTRFRCIVCRRILVIQKKVYVND